MKSPATVGLVRSLPRFGMALLVVVLSLALVATGQPPANAFVDAPKPVQLKGAVKAAPLRMLGFTSPVGLAISGIGFAAMAYNERDTWLPIVEGWLNGDKTAEGDPPDRNRGIYGITNVRYDEDSRILYFDGVASVTNSGPDPKTTDIRVKRRVCGNDLGATTSNTQRSIALNFTYGVVQPRQHVPFTGATISACSETYPNLIEFEVETQEGGRTEVVTVGTPAEGWTNTTTVQCKNVTTGDFETLTGIDPAHPERLAVPSCEAALGPGWIPWETTISGGPNGQTPKELVTVTTKEDVYDEYADCFGAGGLICDINVWVDGNVCVPGVATCTEWWSISRNQPGRVQCRFGSHVIPMDDCRLLRHAYGTKTKTITKTNTKGEPITNPEVDTTPGTSPGGTPTTGTNPSTPGTTPGTTTDPDSRSCFGDTWSLNPVDWVYVPVKCAMLWAFKPQTSLKVRLDTIQTNLTGKAPFSWFAGIAALPAAVPGGACPDWRVKVEHGIGSIDKNVVCDSSYTAAIRAARPVLTAFMIGLALWPLIRSTAYAAFPIIKPQPGMLR